jgi:hypothetical protein
MDDVVYAMHTKMCTFLLDATGVCKWIVSRTGMVPVEIRRCVGAQFMACLHPDLEGGLAGELVIGAAALFVKTDSSTGRFMLMRSGTIQSVEERGASRAGPPPGAVLSDDTLDLGSSNRGGDTVPPPPVSFSDHEHTVTLTLPLYRANAPRRV